MKGSNPLPSLASMLAEGQRQQWAQPPRRMGEPREGGPPHTWDPPTEGGCGCDDPGEARPPRPPAAARERGAGAEVQVALQARAIWAQRVRRVERRRARIWPGEGPQRVDTLPGRTWPTPCACDPQSSEPVQKRPRDLASKGMGIRRSRSPSLPSAVKVTWGPSKVLRRAAPLSPTSSTISP